MENNLEFIDQYFKKTALPGEKEAFENRVMNDPLFAEDVAFYLSALQAEKQQLIGNKKERFRELYQQYTSGLQKPGLVQKLWPVVAAAAAIVVVILSWYFFIKPPSTQQLAGNYITQNFTTLGITMGSNQEEFQKGLDLYNKGQLKQALQQFEKLINLDSSNFTAKKYAGIASLRLQQFDKALHYFKLLENQPGLYANPGAFLQATTLLKRNLPGDKQAAKTLLQEVVQNDLEGRETAEQWLKKW